MQSFPEQLALSEISKLTQASSHDRESQAGLLQRIHSGKSPASRTRRKVYLNPSFVVVAPRGCVMHLRGSFLLHGEWIHDSECSPRSKQIFKSKALIRITPSLYEVRAGGSSPA